MQEKTPQFDVTLTPQFDFTPTLHERTNCDGDPLSTSDDDSSTKRHTPFEIVTPHRLHPNIRRIAGDDDDDVSDTDSLAR